jgi:hypothetical protein
VRKEEQEANIASYDISIDYNDIVSKQGLLRTEKDSILVLYVGAFDNDTLKLTINDTFERTMVLTSDPSTSIAGNGIFSKRGLKKCSFKINNGSPACVYLDEWPNLMYVWYLFLGDNKYQLKISFPHKPHGFM